MVPIPYFNSLLHLHSKKYASEYMEVLECLSKCVVRELAIFFDLSSTPIPHSIPYFAFFVIEQGTWVPEVRHVAGATA